MKTIYKYPIADIVKIPKHAQIIHYGMDPINNPCLWAFVNTEETEFEEKHFVLVGTGWPLDNMIANEEYYYEFITTIKDGPYMWHIFEESAINGVKVTFNG